MADPTAGNIKGLFTIKQGRFVTGSSFSWFRGKRPCTFDKYLEEKRVQAFLVALSEMLLLFSFSYTSDLSLL